MRAWWVTVGDDGLAMIVEKDSRTVDDVLTRIRARLRDLCARGGCGSFTVAVHPDGPDCDHEVPR
jgi:hypothetical protein